MRIVAEDSTVKFRFNTVRFSTGAPYTLAGTPSLYARVDGSATEITAGFTLTVDFDSKTGENDVVLDLSASASFTAGAFVEICLAAGTVDSVSVVGLKVYEFQIGTNGSLDALITRGLLALPAVAHSSSGGLPTIGTSTGQINPSSGKVPATLASTDVTGNIAADLQTIKTQPVTCAGGVTVPAATLASTTNITAAAGCAVSSIGTNVLTAAALATDAVDEIAMAVDTQITTGALQTVIGIAGAGLTNLGGMSITMKAQVQTEAEEALQTYHLDHLLASADPGSVVANSSFWAKLHSKSATPAYSSYDNTTDSLEANRDNIGTAGAGLTAIPAVASVTDRTGFSLAASGLSATPLSSLTADSVGRLQRSTSAIATCTVGNGSTTTSIVTSACSPAGAVADQFKGRIVIFASDTTTAALRGQATDITASSNSATPTLTVTALTTAPASTDTFTIT